MGIAEPFSACRYGYGSLGSPWLGEPSRARTQSCFGLSPRVVSFQRIRPLLFSAQGDNALWQVANWLVTRYHARPLPGFARHRLGRRGYGSRPLHFLRLFWFRKPPNCEPDFLGILQDCEKGCIFLATGAGESSHEPATYIEASDGNPGPQPFQYTSNPLSNKAKTPNLVGWP